jgi:hypothetical protein
MCDMEYRDGGNRRRIIDGNEVHVSIRVLRHMRYGYLLTTPVKQTYICRSSETALPAYS